jgi:DDE superfamily endonuclease
MVGRTSNWEDELGRWLQPFLDRLGHKARRRMCPLYVSGLIGPGDRKSVQPMAARLSPGDYDQLHHFIADGVWDAAPLESELLVQADRLVGGEDAVLVIDDTALPKKGDSSVGVAAQYASSLGKKANCQTLVSLTLARGEVPVMVALRLFLPESWTSDAARLKRTGVPVEYRVARTKPEIALADRSRDRSRSSPRLCTGGCRLRPQRTVPSGAHDTRAFLGRWYPSSPQGVSGWGQADLAGCGSGSSPQAAHSGYPVESGRRHVGQRQVAECKLAKRNQGAAGSPLRCSARPDRRWTTAADQGHGPAAPSRR